jgi:hypothetical protein
MTEATGSRAGKASHGSSLFRVTGSGGGCRSKKTVGITFDPHLTSETDSSIVALGRYQSIVEAPDFGDLDYESVDPKATKPTKGAIRVNDLLETITGRDKCAKH